MITEIVEMGITYPIEQTKYITEIVNSFIYVSLIGLITVFIMFLLKIKNKYIDLLGIISIIMLLIFSIGGNEVYSKTYDEAVDYWKEEIALPYIESIPDTIINLRTIKEINKEGIIYGDSDIFSKRYIVVIKDTIYPYLTYKYLDTDLGHGINSGIYFATLYISKEQYEKFLKS